MELAYLPQLLYFCGCYVSTNLKNVNEISLRFFVSFPDPPEVHAEETWVHTGIGVRSELICHVLADPVAQVSKTFFSFLVFIY